MVLTSFRSPNFDERPDPKAIESIIIHYTAMESAISAISWLSNPQSKVSAHYVICKTGKIYQLIDDAMRAWHAGQSFWNGRKALNDTSIGIELDNVGHEPFSPHQIRSLIELCNHLLKKHAIPSFQILGHSDIAPQRKQDPGPYFPWKLLAQKNLGLWVSRANLGSKSSSEILVPLKRNLQTIGYDINPTPHWDESSINVTKAFMSHFLPEPYLKYYLYSCENTQKLRSFLPALYTLSERLRVLLEKNLS